MNPHGRCPRRSERRVSAIPPRRRVLRCPRPEPYCAMPAPRIERDHRALQARVPTTQTRQASLSRAEPTGYDPATSRATGGALPIAPRLPSAAVRGEWHSERMTTSPGSRVSCETATRPPATARVTAVLRVLRTASHTSHRLSKSRGRKRRSPHPACAQVGRSRRPGGSVGGPMAPVLGPPLPSAQCTSFSRPAHRDLGARSR